MSVRGTLRTKTQQEGKSAAGFNADIEPYAVLRS